MKIDVMHLSNTSSVYLPQAAYLTHGIFWTTSDYSNLHQILLYHFLSDGEHREFFKTPTNKQVDFRAICFCHKKYVDRAIVCSVCLASIDINSILQSKSRLPKLPDCIGLINDLLKVSRSF